MVANYFGNNAQTLEQLYAKYGGPQGLPPAQPQKLIDTVNLNIKSAITKEQNILNVLETLVADYCMREYGAYGKGTFSGFIYTMSVLQMNNGKLAGITPDVPWYEPKYEPETVQSSWKKRNEQKQENTVVETVTKKEFEELKEMILNVTKSVHTAGK